jgi:dolichol-phosphate mannosyltransferase
MSISIILPTFNEKGNITKLIEKIIQSLATVSYTYEVIVVDDNSPDKTADICKRYFSNNKKVKVYVRVNERGFASAIYFGIKKSKGDVIIVMDTDFSHDPKLIPLMVSNIKKYDIVIGSRYAKLGGGEDKKRYLLSKIFNMYLRYLLKIPISDFLFGYFCINKKFLLENDLLSRKIFTGFGDYFIRLIYYIHKSKGTFLEIPAFYKSRIYGTSKSNIFKMFFTYTGTSLRLLIS